MLAFSMDMWEWFFANWKAILALHLTFSLKVQDQDQGGKTQEIVFLKYMHDNDNHDR